MKKYCYFWFLFFLIQGIAQSQEATLKSAKDLTLSQRFEDASALYQNLLKDQPNNGDLFYYHGINQINAYVNDPFSNSKEDVAKEAQEIFKKGIQADSLNPLNYIGLGIIALFEKGDTTLANKSLGKAEASLPKKVKKYTPRILKPYCNWLLRKLMPISRVSREPINWEI